MADRPLTPRQARFVEEYLVDRNATQAAIRAGYAAKDADVQGPRLLGYAGVEAAIAAGAAALSERVGVTQADVLRRWIDIATADPNELIQHRRAPCRFCYGINHHHQWKTEREFKTAVAEALANQLAPPTDEGGYGYRVTADPNPDCPECSGDGVGYTLAMDTKTLSGKARLLYAGVKQTRDGLEVKLQDQAKALENVARHLGMFVERREVTGDINHRLVPDERLESRISELLGKAGAADAAGGAGATEGEAQD